MAQHYSTFTVLDYSNEKSPFKVFNGAITSASIGGFITEFGQMRDAMAAMSLGVVSNEQWVGDNTVLSQVPPVDPDAQRERKALVVYQGDTNNKLYTVTIPAARTKAANGDPLILPGTDKYDLTVAPVSGFVTRFNSFARTPDSDQETVTIVEIRLVGRNI